MAVVSGAEATKYLSSILEELVFSRKGYTKWLCDNTASIMIENKKKPKERTRYIYVQNFYL